MSTNQVCLSSLWRVEKKWIGKSCSKYILLRNNYQVCLWKNLRKNMLLVSRDTVVCCDAVRWWLCVCLLVERHACFSVKSNIYWWYLINSPDGKKKPSTTVAGGLKNGNKNRMDWFPPADSRPLAWGTVGPFSVVFCICELSPSWPQFDECLVMSPYVFLAYWFN